MSNYDANAALDAKFVGKWTLSSATITDKHNQQYDLIVDKFNFGLNADGTCFVSFDRPYFSDNALKKMEADKQERVDSLNNADKKEYEKELDEFNKEKDVVVDGTNDSDDNEMSFEFQRKYKKMIEVNSDANVENIKGVNVSNGEWRNNNTNLMVYGNYSHAEFEIQDANTLIYKYDNVVLVLKKA